MNLHVWNNEFTISENDQRATFVQHCSDKRGLKGIQLWDCVNLSYSTFKILGFRTYTDDYLNEKEMVLRFLRF